VHEVCFEKTVRVFKQVSAKDIAASDKKAIIHNQHRVLEVEERKLGNFDPAKMFPDDSHSSSDDARVVYQVYSEGDVCQNGERYYANVKIACFLTKSSPPEIVSVRWISKCGSFVLMHSPGLCDADDERRSRLRNRWRKSVVSKQIDSDDGDEEDLAPISCQEVK